jgi:hypothetical protein
MDILRLNVLGLAEAVDGRPALSGECAEDGTLLLSSESSANVLARGDMKVLVFAISLNLDDWICLGL